MDAAEEKMQMAVEFLDDALARIRAGKASPRILDGILVEYYGSMVPLSNVSTINTPDARTITILPWEKPMLREIEKAILNSEVGITPENNGEIIRLGIPPLTEEPKQEAENAKVSVRNARRDAIEGLKKAVKEGMPEDVEKDGEASVQKLHDKYVKRIDEIFAAKEKEILTV